MTRFGRAVLGAAAIAVHTPALAAAAVATPASAAPEAAPASAQASAALTEPAQQAPWSAWLGCWRAVMEGAALPGMVCVVPGGDAATVTMLTVEEDAVSSETQVRADGTARQVEDGGCTGTERAQWSSDGRRVMLRTELDCDGVRRVSTGILAFTGEHEWVDVQAMSVGESHATRTIRYRAVRADDVPAAVAARLPAGRDRALESARWHAAAPLDLDAVVEASRVVEEPAVEALLAAAGRGFDLDARTLVRLEQQGVAPSTLDVMIALSYPERFAVRSPTRETRDVGMAYGPSSLMIQCIDPFHAGMAFRAECGRYFGLRGYSRYGSLYYGYSPWGYDPYGWRYGRVPVIIVRPGEEAREPAQAVRGRGYTRGGSTSTGNARPRSGGQGSEGGSRSGEAREGSRGSSQPAATPSSGSTGSSRDTGRTARPRDGGGDG